MLYTSVSLRCGRIIDCHHLVCLTVSLLQYTTYRRLHKLAILNPGVNIGPKLSRLIVRFSKTLLSGVDIIISNIGRDSALGDEVVKKTLYL